MKINKQILRQIIKEELQNVLEQDELAGDTLAGKTMAVDEPPRDELDGDTLAGKTVAVDDEGNEISDADLERMHLKYSRVKQILAKLVKEL